MTCFDVAVLVGGPSTEANVSRTSGRAVAEALAACEHRPRLVELGPEMVGLLRSGPVDVAFPVTHGPVGEDGCLQGLLEVCGLPYVGSGVLASALAADKPYAKRMFRAASLPVPKELVVRARDDLRGAAARVRRQFDAGVVVKPASGGSAIATTRLGSDATDDALVVALEAALAVDPAALVEEFILGLEVTCGVLERCDAAASALPPTLIEAKAADWYDFESRYAADGSVHHCPAPFEPGLSEEIQRLALGAHLALGCRDLSRADFVVDPPTSTVTLLEVNTLPGMTSTSLFPEAAAATGISFEKLCDGLVRRAHARGKRDVVDALPMP